MKNFIVTLVAIFAMVSFSANAQVKSINTYDAQACGEYLVKHQKDTIVNVFSLEKDGMKGKVVRSVYMGSKRNILSVRIDTIWDKRKVVRRDELSLSQKESILRGEKLESNPKCYHLFGAKIVCAAVNKYGWSSAVKSLAKEEVQTVATDKYGWSSPSHICRWFAARMYFISRLNSTNQLKTAPTIR